MNKILNLLAAKIGKCTGDNDRLAGQFSILGWGSLLLGHVHPVAAQLLHRLSAHFAVEELVDAAGGDWADACPSQLRFGCLYQGFDVPKSFRQQPRIAVADVTNS